MANTWLDTLRRAKAGETAAIQQALDGYKKMQARAQEKGDEGGHWGRGRYASPIRYYTQLLGEAQKRDEYNRQAAEARAKIEAANARIAQSKTLVQENAALNRQNTTEQDTAQVVEGGTALQAAPAGASTGSDWLAKRKKQGIAKSLGVNV